MVVDEAAMVDTRLLHELLSEVHKAGAKLILAGDDRQLASIERGGAVLGAAPGARIGGDHRGHPAEGG